MATRRIRRWIAIGGATAAVAIGAWGAVALGAPTLSAPAITNLPAVALSWTDDATPDASSYSLTRTPGACPQAGAPSPLVSGLAATTYSDSPGEGLWCYQVSGLYGGVAAAASAPVLVDTTAPTTPVFLPGTPAAGTSVRGTITVGASSSDTGSGVASVTLSIAGLSPPLVTTSGASATAAWNTAGLADGPHTLQATAVDLAGNTSVVASVTVVVDNTPPADFTVVAPSTVAGSPTLSWSPVVGYTYTAARDGVQLGAVTPPWTDPGNPAPGTHSYVITAFDSALNAKAAPAVSVLVVAASATAPRMLSAASPTNAVPHLVWQKPTTFAVSQWKVFRDGAEAATVPDADTTSFDDTSVGAQGPHVYTVQAFSGVTPGDMSSPITVIFDTVPPVLAPPTGVSNADGSIGLSWADASDPAPGSGLARYVVRRSGLTSPPADPTSGTAICTVTLPAPTSCVDSAAVSGTTYSYGVFALDGAGNATRQLISVQSIDTVPPDPVTGFRGSVGPTTAHLYWDSPVRQGNDSDLAGFHIIRLAAGAKVSTNPRDGTEVCPGLGAKDADCFVQNLTTKKPATFAIYAVDAVPNYSAPTIVTVTPRGDSTNPHLPTKVRFKRVGTRVTVTWVSPPDRDLSHFVVNLNRNGPAKNPGVRPIVFKGRGLKASFSLHLGQVAYVNLFAVDLSANYSRVSRLIVMPKRLVVTKSKHKVVKKQPAKTTTAPKKKKKTSKPVAVTIQKA